MTLIPISPAELVCVAQYWPSLGRRQHTLPETLSRWRWWRGRWPPQQWLWRATSCRFQEDLRGLHPDDKDVTITITAEDLMNVSHRDCLHSPSRRTFGILAPRLWYCWGFFKKLTNSRISTLASSQPATSLNRTPVLFFIILALDSLMLKGFPDPLPPRPPINGPRRMVSMINPTSTNVGRTLKKRVLWGKRNINRQHE